MKKWGSYIHLYKLTHVKTHTYAHTFTSSFCLIQVTSHSWQHAFYIYRVTVAWHKANADSSRSNVKQRVKGMLIHECNYYILTCFLWEAWKENNTSTTTTTSRKKGKETQVSHLYTAPLSHGTFLSEQFEITTNRMQTEQIRHISMSPSSWFCGLLHPTMLLFL